HIAHLPEPHSFPTRRSSDLNGLLLNLAINYSGRAEILDAVNGIIETARREGRLDSLRVDEELFAASLATANSPDPDLLIRTSGRSEEHTSELQSLRHLVCRL